MTEASIRAWNSDLSPRFPATLWYCCQCHIKVEIPCCQWVLGWQLRDQPFRNWPHQGVHIKILTPSSKILHSLKMLILKMQIRKEEGTASWHCTKGLLTMKPSWVPASGLQWDRRWRVHGLCGASVWLPGPAQQPAGSPPWARWHIFFYHWFSYT